MDMENNQFMNYNNPDKKMVIEDFCMKNVLGKGSFAKVILVKKIDNGKFYAMKVLKKSKLEKQRHVDNVIAERNILVGVNHPFVIKLHYSFQNSDKLYFILEFCAGGELFNLLHKVQRFTEDQTRFYIAQIVLAIEHLHSLNIIYRDLKPENVMIDFEGYIRITDFGLSKNNINDHEKTYSVCGTPEYLAPEILTMQGHEKTADWWSLGALIYELLTGLPPFYNQNREVMYELIKNYNVNIPDYVSPVCKDLIYRLLQKNPENRLGKNGAYEIKSHPWFQNVDWEILFRKEYRPPFIPILDNIVTYFPIDFTQQPIDSVDPLQSVKQVNQNNNIGGFTYNQSQNKEMDFQQ
ncbi:hypothetical protein ABPG73_002307 [Tetrahymena malaccensis]